MNAQKVKTKTTKTEAEGPKLETPNPLRWSSVNLFFSQTLAVHKILRGDVATY